MNWKIEDFNPHPVRFKDKADFVLNLGLYWETIDSDLSASLIYNKVGDRIAKVGFGGLGDVVELARDQVDLSFQKILWSNLTLKIVAKDLPC